MEFVRFGGLSQVNQKKINKLHRPDGRTYHQAPLNKGIYAFIYPYIENFLWAWRAFPKTEERKEWTEEQENKHFQKEYRRTRKQVMRRQENFFLQISLTLKTKR